MWQCDIVGLTIMSSHQLLLNMYMDWHEASFDKLSNISWMRFININTKKTGCLKSLFIIWQVTIYVPVVNMLLVFLDFRGGVISNVCNIKIFVMEVLFWKLGYSCDKIEMQHSLHTSNLNTCILLAIYEPIKTFTNSRTLQVISYKTSRHFPYHNTLTITRV